MHWVNLFFVFSDVSFFKTILPHPMQVYAKVKEWTGGAEDFKGSYGTTGVNLNAVGG